MPQLDETTEHRRAMVRGALVASCLAALVVGGLAIAGRGGSSASTPTSMPASTATTATTTSTATTASAISMATTASTASAISMATTASTASAIATTSTSTVPIAPTLASPPEAAGAPEVDAAAYVVLDVSTGRWLAESSADAARPVGSVMKLLTAYVVMQAGDPERMVTVPALELDTRESAIGLYEGERLTRSVLLRAMLIVSANDAARTLAADVGGTQDGFVSMMNTAAASLGLDDTVAANPIGLDADGAHSTARDLAALTAVLMQDPTFRTTVARTSASLHGQTFASTNQSFLTGFVGADGVKTGHTTQAGYCLAASATRDGRQIITIVLGSSTETSRVAATEALLDWAYGQPG